MTRVVALVVVAVVVCSNIVADSFPKISLQKINIDLKYKNSAASLLNVNSKTRADEINLSAKFKSIFVILAVVQFTDITGSNPVIPRNNCIL